MDENPITLWEKRVAVEENYLKLYENLVIALQSELDESAQDSKYYKSKIEIYQMENEIKAKEYYLNSLKSDKAMQEVQVAMKMHFAKENSGKVLQKARSPLMARGDANLELQGVLKEKHETDTEDWADWIFRINQILLRLQAH
jgi:hypothetical protein